VNRANFGNRFTGMLSWQLLSVVLLLTILFTISSADAASLDAKVDRPMVIDGETVVLYIEGTDLPNTPDTNALLQNFRIIQSGVSNSQSIVNGKRTIGFTIRLELQAKSIGATVIPAFTVNGVSSDPITIEVVARGTPGVEPRDKVFAELSVDQDNPYVQEQVILLLKIFDDGNLASADPNISGNSDFQIEQLPLGREQIVEREGVQYRVNTFRYALFPQKSGEITIDALTIPASIRDASYGGNLILRNTPTRRIELRADALTISVKPRAADSTAGWWLPVKALELKHKWSADINNAKAGEPFTLTLEIIAAGATSTQLPEVAVPDVSGLKVYVDNPSLVSQPDADNLVSMRREKWSVIPNREGQITLPEVVVKWWDTTADVERTSVIDAQVLTVGAASGVATTASDVAQQSDSSVEISSGASIESDQNTDVQRKSSAISSSSLKAHDLIQTGNRPSGVWFWLAIAAMLAWLATLAAWWWTTRNRKAGSAQPVASSVNVSEQKALRKMRSLSKSQDASAYSNAVLEWSKARWRTEPLYNLPEVAVRLGSHRLIDSMRQLDQLRFSNNRSTIDAETQAISLDAIQKEIEVALDQSKVDQPEPTQHALPQL